MNMKLKNGERIFDDSEEIVEINSVIDAMYTEVWEETVIITSPCLVDLKTRKVVEISRDGNTTIDTGECKSDVRRYVTIGNQDYKVIDEDEFQEDYTEDWDPDDSDSCDVFWMK